MPARSMFGFDPDCENAADGSIERILGFVSILTQNSIPAKCLQSFEDWLLFFEVSLDEAFDIAI